MSEFEEIPRGDLIPIQDSLLRCAHCGGLRVRVGLDAKNFRAALRCMDCPAYVSVASTESAEDALRRAVDAWNRRPRIEGEATGLLAIEKASRIIRAEYLRLLLEMHGGNMRAVAERMGVPRSTLIWWMRDVGVYVPRNGYQEKRRKGKHPPDPLERGNGEGMDMVDGVEK